MKKFKCCFIKTNNNRTFETSPKSYFETIYIKIKMQPGFPKAIKHLN